MVSLRDGLKNCHVGTYTNMANFLGEDREPSQSLRDSSPGGGAKTGDSLS